ncbi:MAG TPA: chromate efflux transporter [Myxococcota bacterium]|nr:chromate efflux transporter [Myxococcota bacterium]
MSADSASAPPSFAETVRTFARIGLESFGGPAGQIAVMHRVLVDEKRWISEERFLHALGYCTLLPGPEAMQLATYAGWLRHRTAGGLAAGVLFVLPGFVSILALSFLYVLGSGAAVVQGLFYGIKPAVLALVIEAVVRIGRRALGHPVHVAIAALAFAAIFALGVPFPWIVLAAGVLGAAGARVSPAIFGGAPVAATPPPRGAFATALRTLAIWLPLWLTPVVLLLATRGRGDLFAELGLFFSQTAVVTFGGAYAVLAYVAQRAVDGFGWLTAGEMLDGLGLAETTPGPLIQVVQFVGFLAAWREPGALPAPLAAVLASLLVTWVTYAPCFLWIFVGAPYVERLRASAVLRGALAGILAAVVGVIANLAVWFGLHVLFREQRHVEFGPLALDLPRVASADLAACAIAAAAALAVFRFRVGVGWLLGGAAAAGIALRLAGLV